MPTRRSKENCWFHRIFSLYFFLEWRLFFCTSKHLLLSTNDSLYESSKPIFVDLFDSKYHNFSGNPQIYFHFFLLNGNKFVYPFLLPELWLSDEVEKHIYILFLMLLDKVSNALDRKLVLEILIELVGPAFQGTFGRLERTDCLCWSFEDFLYSLHVPMELGLHNWSKFKCIINRWYNIVIYLKQMSNLFENEIIWGIFSEIKADLKRLCSEPFRVLRSGALQTIPRNFRINRHLEFPEDVSGVVSDSVYFFSILPYRVPLAILWLLILQDSLSHMEDWRAGWQSFRHRPCAKVWKVMTYSSLLFVQRWPGTSTSILEYRLMLSSVWSRHLHRRVFY